MAVYHASLRALSRSQGQSAVAAAAYRAGIALHDERLGLTQDYSRRKGVAFVSILTPPGAPPWASETATLWNAAEGAETRVNARVARELIVSLPHELSQSARQDLAQAVAAVLVDRYGVAVQLAIHAPDRAGDGRNHHVHLLMTTRALGPGGFGPKVRVLDDRATGPQEVEWLRAQLAELTNRALSAAGLVERVDHRSLVDQAAEAEKAGDFERAARLTREPTQYLGRAATAALRQGRPGEEALANAAIRVDNRRALAAFLVQTRAGRRRLRAAAQAKLAARQVGGGALPGVVPDRRRKAASGYEEGLLDVVRSGRRLASAAIHAAGLRQRVADQIAHQESPAMRLLRQQAADARQALEAAQGEARGREIRRRQLARERSAMQAAWDAGPGPRPKVWRPTQRQQWERDRRQLWGRLRKAIAAEREAQEDLGPVAKAALRSKVTEARRRLAELEAELRKVPEPAPHPHMMKGPGVAPRPSGPRGP